MSKAGRGQDLPLSAGRGLMSPDIGLRLFDRRFIFETSINQIANAGDPSYGKLRNITGRNVYQMERDIFMTMTICGRRPA